MSSGIRLVPSGNSAPVDQDLLDRATDPTPKDADKPTPSFKDNAEKVMAWLKSWAPIVTRALASGAVYAGLNYGVHKMTKSGKKDPAAIKTMSAGKIIKQGGIQAVASGLSGATYQTIGGYIPEKVMSYATAWTATKPLVTGAYKTVGTMGLSGVPSFWNGVKDYAISAGSDYVVDFAYPLEQ